MQGDAVKLGRSLIIYLVMRILVRIPILYAKFVEISQADETMIINDESLDRILPY